MMNLIMITRYPHIYILRFRDSILLILEQLGRRPIAWVHLLLHFPL